jgi:DNA-nicking Smr family endonuclease
MRSKKKNKDNYTPTIDAELDLHGQFADGARSLTRDFLNDSYRSGFSRVRIITGKGNRSKDGVSVLGAVIKSYLNEQGYDYTYAKIQNGGEGALEVRLK